MSYLAMSAASIDNDNNQISNYESPINKKRQNNNKTQKYRQPSSDFDPQKVNSVLQSIHNNVTDDDNDLGNYNPNFASQDLNTAPFSIPNSRIITVGAPYHFYFGLKKGKTSFDRFAIKWIGFEIITD